MCIATALLPRPGLQRWSEAPIALRPDPQKTNRPPPPIPQKTEPEVFPPPFPFLSLPTELRVKVYDVVLISPTGICLSSTIANTARRKGGAVSPPKWRGAFITGDLPRRPTVALLATCELIENEALPVLYGQPFSFDDVSTAGSFLAQLRQATLGLLRDVSLGDWVSNCFQNAGFSWSSFFIETLSQATKIRRLCFSGRLLLPEFLIGVELSGMSVCHPCPGRPRGQLVAEGLYKDWGPFLRAVASERGIDAVLHILVLGDECFHEGIIPAYTNHGLWVRRYYPFKGIQLQILEEVRTQRGIFEKTMRRLLHQDARAEALAAQLTPLAISRGHFHS